jgi:hypothetical protein
MEENMRRLLICGVPSRQDSEMEALLCRVGPCPQGGSA